MYLRYINIKYSCGMWLPFSRMASSSLLPKNIGSFADSTYWRKFFERRGDKAFEWYGSYSEIGHSIEKYLKPSDRILQIGCGNSTLADDLYDNGFRRIINIDIIENVIQAQLKKNSKIRPELEFYVADITVNSDDPVSTGPFQPSSFQVVLDKGTLDALLPPDSDQQQQTVVKGMFDRADHVLAIGGRYVVVTLAQPEVISSWVQHFTGRPYILRVQQLNGGQGGLEDGWKLPVFLLVAIKLKQMVPANTGLSTMYEYLEFGTNPTPRRFKTGDDLLEMVKSAQEYTIFCNKAKSEKYLDELNIELYSPEYPNSPRYTIYLTTNKDKSRKMGHPYAIFVVPQGREHEWLFSTVKGRLELCSQASVGRLAVVCLGRDHKFENMDNIKKELDERVMDFAPREVDKNKNHNKIAYLSVGTDLGNRKVVFNGESALSGPYVVEDVSYNDGNNHTAYRRLIFLKSQNLIQSEARLLPINGRRKGSKQEIDWSYLCCAHHRIMLASLAGPVTIENASVCLLGLGGGCLATFIGKHFPQVALTSVELDPAVVDVAQQCFQFPCEEANGKLKCVVADGVDFIREKLEKKDELFDVVLLDVAGPSHVAGLSCPLPAFVQDEFLEIIRAVLKPEGVLAFNLVTRDEEKRKEVKDAVARHFPRIVTQPVEEELNEVLIAFSNDHDGAWRNGFLQRLHRLTQQLKLNAQSSKSKQTSSDSVNEALERLANWK